MATEQARTWSHAPRDGLSPTCGGPSLVGVASILDIAEHGLPPEREGIGVPAVDRRVRDERRQARSLSRVLAAGNPITVPPYDLTVPPYDVAASRRWPSSRTAAVSSGPETTRTGTGRQARRSAYDSGLLVLPLAVARLHHRKDTEWRVLSGVDASTVALAWLEVSDNPAVAAFVGIVRGRTANSSRD